MAPRKPLPETLEAAHKEIKDLRSTVKLLQQMLERDRGLVRDERTKREYIEGLHREIMTKLFPPERRDE